MPDNTSSHTLAVSDASAAVGVGVHSLRRWAEWHSAYLSPGANPAPGQAKRFTGRDIEVLRHVKALRSEGLQTVTINEQLAGLTFAEIDTSEQNGEDVALTPAPPDTPTQAPAALVALDDLQTQLRALQQASIEAKQAARAGWWWLVAGIGIGLGLALLFELAALVASRGH